MRRHQILALLACVVSFQGCALVHLESQLRSIDRAKARALSDQFLEDVKQKRYSTVYGEMAKAFRDATSRIDFETALSALFDQYGMPLNSEDGQEIESVEVLANGHLRRLLKRYYIVETTKYKKGFYYLSVDIVSEGDGLAVSGLYFNKLL